MDRILAAQVRLERCTFVSTDLAFDAILHERVWSRATALEIG
jgi:PIN domain nuclease of toxin-antitoxin system